MRGPQVKLTAVFDIVECQVVQLTDLLNGLREQISMPVPQIQHQSAEVVTVESAPEPKPERLTEPVPPSRRGSYRASIRGIGGRL